MMGYISRLIRRLPPSFLWMLFAKKNRKIFKKSHFILSFDCDTEEDIAVALEVQAKLQDMGITPVYAVPGELLKKGETVYKKIFESGAEFINHGGRSHTYFDTIHDRHASCFFYHEQPVEILREDIIQGHQTLQDVLGFIPKGWRTPHFGTFQNTENLNFLYSTLKELQYDFSTSTVPGMAYRYGPVYKKNGLIEIPVTGIFSEPFNIMDTWAYFAAPDRMKTPNNYLKDLQHLAEFAFRHPILINIYGDPSHIYDKPEFFESMKVLVQKSQNINYSQLIEIFYENIRNI